MGSSFLQFSSILTQWHNLFHRGFFQSYIRKKWITVQSVTRNKNGAGLKSQTPNFHSPGMVHDLPFFEKFFQPPPFILCNYSHSHLSRFRLHCRCSLRHFHLNRFHHHYPKGLLRTLHPHRVLQWMNRHRSPRPSAHGFR